MEHEPLRQVPVPLLVVMLQQVQMYLASSPQNASSSRAGADHCRQCEITCKGVRYCIRIIASFFSFRLVNVNTYLVTNGSFLILNIFSRLKQDSPIDRRLTL